MDSIFNKIVLKKAAAVLAPNPPKRMSGTQMVTGVIGEKRVREALMPTENEQRDKEICTLQAKLAALEAEKGAARPAVDKRPASRQQPASRGGPRQLRAAAAGLAKGGGSINSSAAERVPVGRASEACAKAVRMGRVGRVGHATTAFEAGGGRWTRLCELGSRRRVGAVWVRYELVLRIRG